MEDTESAAAELADGNEGVMKVLVTAATKHGATAEIAAAIGEVLQGAGVDAAVDSPEEVAAMPGDDIVPDPSFTATRPITIAAPPEEVWPWNVQLDTGRAGFYSYDLFDNAARPSADRILPRFQATRVWDQVAGGAARWPTHGCDIEVREMRSRPRRLWAAGIATAAGVVAAGQLFPANWPSPTRARAVR